jgi:hypothetical protein
MHSPNTSIKNIAIYQLILYTSIIQLRPRSESNVIYQFTNVWPPLWSSGKSSWLQIQRHGFDSRCYQISWEVVNLERGPLGPVSTTEELLERKISGSGLEDRDYGRRRSTALTTRQLALTSLTSMDSRYGGQHGIYGVSSPRQPTWCGPPARLIKPRAHNFTTKWELVCYEMSHSVSRDTDR